MFEPEMRQFCSSVDEMAFNLKHYISTECWSLALPLIPGDQIGDMNAINAVMENIFDETKHRLDLVEEFLGYKQIICDVQRYTANKVILFRKAYPTHNSEIAFEFREGWLQGLAPPLAKEVAKLDDPSYLDAPYAEVIATAVRAERALKRISKTYEVCSKPSSNPPSVSNSHHANVNKKKGKRDKKHGSQQPQSQTPPSQAAPKPTGSTPPAGTAQKPTTPTNPNAKRYAMACNATDKCKQDATKHPYFACTNTTCKTCQGKHTHLKCPQSKCTICNKDGHDTKVHGLSPKTPVF